jgi:hypothetical protein
MFKLSGISANKKLFKEAIENCNWLKYKSFKPGLWAMDNFAFYTLFNILDRIKPKNILEFGMGQSSKMVHQYAQFFENVTAVTIEHNREWAETFCKNIPEDLKINVKFFDTEIIEVNGFKTLTYKNIDGIWGKGGYDLIIVDGPFGSKHYSRSQIINIIKYGLPEQFCIFMDDTERNGEKETVKEICRELGEKGIKHLIKENRGIRKHHTIIYSADTVLY